MDTVRALYIRLHRTREQLGSPQGPVQPSPGGHVVSCGESPLHRRLAELACVLRRARITPEEDAALSARCEVEMRPRERSGEGSAVDVCRELNRGLERDHWTIRYYRGTVAVAEYKLRRELASRRGE